MFTSTPLFIGGLPGGMEWAVILLIAVLLFGANKIPKLARSSGEAIGEFQKGREEVEQELQDMRDGPDDDSESTTTDTETTSESTTTDTDSETASSN
ncbi:MULTISPECIES: twin-arginine translocase TatA/TatE family subunit [Halobacterium]|uniref:twin-arginine translocase TatA/TatE family subunit n=1 Tax=Halobacterium TaxID=2239 RepID=UPI00073EC70D|nr:MULTISPECIES: twin-arginine translocase TatA/TatE family subunit [Halobacterium]MCG1002580.1 twin-arginine translocase TatA/TatE family subunit [Halobacterium noricense]